MAIRSNVLRRLQQCIITRQPGPPKSWNSANNFYRATSIRYNPRRHNSATYVAKGLVNDTRCGLRPDSGSQPGSRPSHQCSGLARRLRRDVDQPHGRHGLRQPDDPLRGRFRRLHAVSNGERLWQRPLIFAARQLHDRIVLDLVPSIADARRDRYRIDRSISLARRDGSRPRAILESTDGRQRPDERHAAQFWLPVLPAAESARARWIGRGDVDVTPIVPNHFGLNVARTVPRAAGVR